MLICPEIQIVIKKQENINGQLGDCLQEVVVERIESHNGTKR